jgi:hypothetical protein
MAKVTGYSLKEAIKKLERRRDTTKAQFEESLYFFEGEQEATAAREKSVNLAKRVQELEEGIATLQTVQANYNAGISITVQGKKLILTQAVKLMGGAERLEKMWQKAAEIENSGSRYYSPDRVRVAGQEHAKRSIAYDAAVAEAEKASTFVGALRAAVAVANSTEKDLGVPDELLS